MLLDAGINVVSTLNIQHLESLNDRVQALTGVRVRETIPDRIIDDADEIILIDLTPEGARARMEHGHIYPPAQAAAALQNFFRPQNLAALRELALRRTAQEVDEQLEEYMRESAKQHVEVEYHVLVFIDAGAVLAHADPPRLAPRAGAARRPARRLPQARHERRGAVAASRARSSWPKT